MKIIFTSEYSGRIHKRIFTSEYSGRPLFFCWITRNGMQMRHWKADERLLLRFFSSSSVLFESGNEIFDFSTFSQNRMEWEVATWQHRTIFFFSSTNKRIFNLFHAIHEINPYDGEAKNPSNCCKRVIACLNIQK